MVDRLEKLKDFVSLKDLGRCEIIQKRGGVGVGGRGLKSVMITKPDDSVIES